MLIQYIFRWLCKKPGKDDDSFIILFLSCGVIGLLALPQIVLPILGIILAVDLSIAFLRLLLWTFISTALTAKAFWKPKPRPYVPQPVLTKVEDRQSRTVSGLQDAKRQLDIELATAETMPPEERESFIAGANRRYRLKVMNLMNQ